jgi:hypothetical protein
MVVDQGSFFRLQNTEGLTVVGLFMEGTTLTCLETYSDAKKKNPAVDVSCILGSTRSDDKCVLLHK